MQSSCRAVCASSVHGHDESVSFGFILVDPKPPRQQQSPYPIYEANLPELLPAAIDLLSKCRHKLKAASSQLLSPRSSCSPSCEVFELRSFLISLRRVQTRESGVTKSEAMQEIVDELTLRLEADDVPCEDLTQCTWSVLALA
eukprot:4535176-Amphidinium_carterae.2